MKSANKSYTSGGWENIVNPEAVRYYKQVQSTKTTLPADEAWYRKWVGPFTAYETDKFKKELSQENVKTAHVIFDTSGYVIAPESALQ